MPAWVVPAIMGAVSLVSGLVSQNKQRKANQKLQREQMAANEQYLAEQNAYNSPASQMQRFQDARLNPHLIYGQGNPGNQSAPLEATRYEQRYDDVTPAAIQLANQTQMIQSQVQATNANTLKAHAQESLIKLQEKVLARNPLMNDQALGAIIENLVMTAQLKGTEWNMNLSKLKVQQATEGIQIGSAGQELENLVQKYNLGTADAQIKAQIIESQGFQNDLLEIQKKWMSDGEITPQHILQFTQMLLMKLLTFKSK